MYDSKPYFYGTGRRKNSVARVRVYPGTGAITINGRDIDNYFGLETLKLIVRQPLAVSYTHLDVYKRQVSDSPRLRWSDYPGHGYRLP